jgi:hypothetical protein
MGRRKPAPGQWRTVTYPDPDTRHEAHGEGFDEIVLDHWLHVEQMDDHDWWLAVGPLHLYVTADKDGHARIVSAQVVEDGWTEATDRMQWTAPKRKRSR